MRVYLLLLTEMSVLDPSRAVSATGAEKLILVEKKR